MDENPNAQQPPYFDPSTFSNESYVKRVEKPWGYELHWVQENKPYIGKIIHINGGARESLQIHDQREESWLIINGEAKIMWDDPSGKLIETVLIPGTGFSTKVGQRHRLIAISDCDIIEVSTPEKGTTWRVEDDYARPNETPIQRKLERGEL